MVGPSEVEQGATSLVIVVTGPEAVELASASLQVDALILDRCGGTTAIVPIDRALDVLGPTEDGAWLLPGGYCGLQLLLPDESALALSGASDGAPWEATVEVGGISVIEPFFADVEPLLLVVPLGALAAGESELGPVVAEVWVDVDADGMLGPDDVPAS